MGARYSRQTGYTLTRRAPVRPTIRTVQRRVRIGPTAAKFIGLAILAILVGFALTNNGSTATSAYQQNAMRKQVSQVQQDVDSLKLEAERVRSIEQSPPADLQPVNQVDYVNGIVAGASTTKP